jgi:hypothetical protein
LFHLKEKFRSWRGVLDTTLCDQVCQWLAAGRWFSLVSSTNKTDNYSINTTISGPYIYDTILLAKMNRVLFDLEMGKIKRDKKTYFYRSYKNLNRFSYIKELKISFVKIWVRVYLLWCLMPQQYFSYIMVGLCVYQSWSKNSKNFL